MAEFDAYASVQAALEALAKGGVRSASDPTGTVEYYSLEELMAAKRFLDSQTSETKSHFGLRMSKLVPPGTESETVSRFQSRYLAHVVPALEREHGVSVTLTKGTLTSSAFYARRSMREYDAMAEEIALSIAVEQRTYYLPITDCVISGSTVEPQAGWVITEGSDTWQIHHPDASTPAVMKSSNNYEWIVHCKQVS